MKRILWLSRLHDPLPEQLAELQKLFGEHCIVRDYRTFGDAAEIAWRFRECQADELVVVAPLTVVQRLCELGLQPLQAEMHRRDDGTYEHVQFRRITGITVHKEHVG